MSRFQWFFYHLIRLSLALVFVYAGAVKIQDIIAFAGHVAAYQLLPYAMNYLVAATLPYVEFLAGVLLLLNVRWAPGSGCDRWHDPAFHDRAGFGVVAGA